MIPRGLVSNAGRNSVLSASTMKEEVAFLAHFLVNLAPCKAQGPSPCLSLWVCAVLSPSEHSSLLLRGYLCNRTRSDAQVCACMRVCVYPQRRMQSRVCCQFTAIIPEHKCWSHYTMHLPHWTRKQAPSPSAESVHTGGFP